MENFPDSFPEPEPSKDEIMLALWDSARWLGRMIADGGHQNCVSPGHCENTLHRVSDIIRRANYQPPAR